MQKIELKDNEKAMEIIATMEQLHYETAARESIVANMAAAGSANTPNGKIYWEEYMDFFKRYNKIKDQFSEEIISQYTKDKNVGWEVKFDSRELYLYD